MPEGDTVLRSSQGLHRALAGRRLTRAELRWGELGAKDLIGREVLEVVAYGKHLFIRLAAATEVPTMPTVTSEPLTLHTHLRMDGSWRIHGSGSRPWPSADDEQIRAVLENREWTAVGILLGMLDLVPTEAEHRLIEHLGPDIMAGEWEPAGRATAVDRWASSGERPVGEVMLDQTVVAGIGTFYMAESLFVKRISPWTPSDEVDAVSVLDLARKLLIRGAQQATPNTTGDPRRHENAFVHARSGRPCRRCGSTIRVAGIGQPPMQRPAFYCPVCQPGPTPTDAGGAMAPLGSAPHRFGSQRNVGLGPGRRWPGR
ncbi:MAG: Fpg/Nei family DNA glycosylase [Actinomycetota bacterium]|nr:Fpg/Nei family DNA glycosylase [Actinomycetota bacterium]